MLNQININELFKLYPDIPVMDVRSPGEFAQGHISGAINLPLFNNEERAIVGTLYKNSGQKDAILAGLEIAGKKMRFLAEAGIKTAKNNQLILHCWRGGMRSASVAWLFETCGITCYTLKGGYKNYRRYILDYFNSPFKLLMLGGLTGSGKSDILDVLEKHQFQVLKLEVLAHHKGSAFGNLGKTPQNTNEQFENDIFSELFPFDLSKPIFVEDESRNIGRNIIPGQLFDRMTTSPLIVVELETGFRLSRLVEEYGKFPREELQECIMKITKKIGGQNTRIAIESLNEGKPDIAAKISLLYYDKSYNFGLSLKKNSEIYRIEMENADPEPNAEKIINFLRGKKLI